MPGIPVRDVKPWRKLNSTALQRRIHAWLDSHKIAPQSLLLWVGVPTDYALDTVHAMPDSFAVYDIAQVYTHSAHMSPDVGKTERQLLGSIDLALCDSQVLADILGLEGSTYSVIPQGVDATLFREVDRLERRPVVGYVGSDNQAFDMDLMMHVARNMPTTDFEIAGKFEVPFNLPNIRRLGPVEHVALPRLLSSWSVGLVPYKVNEFTYGVLPTKVLEYLAAGLVVVSTRLKTLEVAEFQGVLIAKDAATFQAMIEQALEAEPCPEPTAEWLSANSWESRFDDVEAALQSQGAVLPGSRGAEG